MKDSEIARFCASNLGRMTPAELSEATGLDPAEVVRVANEYYDQVNLTADQRYAKMLIQLEELAAEGIERAKSANNRDSSGNITAAKNALAQLQKMIDDREKRLSAEDNTALYGRILAGIVQSSMDRAIGVLSERYPEIEAKELSEELRKQILIVAAEYDEAV